MGITHVADGAYLAEASGASAVLGAPAGALLNDVVLALLYKENTAAVALPSGFVELGHQACTGSEDFDLYLYGKPSDGAEPANYSFSWTGSVWRTGFTTLFRGATPAIPPEAYSGNTTGTSTNSTSPIVNLTTLGLNRMIVWFGGTWDVSAWNDPTSTTGAATFTAMAPSGAPATRLLHGAYGIQAAAGGSGDVRATTSSGTYTKCAHLVDLAPMVPTPPLDRRRRLRPLLVR